MTRYRFVYDRTTDSVSVPLRDFRDLVHLAHRALGWYLDPAGTQEMMREADDLLERVYGKRV